MIIHLCYMMYFISYTEELKVYDLTLVNIEYDFTS